MRGTIIARDTDFGAVLTTLCETVNGCSGTWFPDWPSAHAAKKLGSLVLGHVADPDDIVQAESFIKDLSARDSAPPVVIITDQGDEEIKIKFLRLGVLDCLESPVNLQRVRYLVDSLGLRERSRKYQQAGKSVAQSAHPAASTFEDRISKLAQVDTSLVLTGETGVGKTFLARRIHDLSKRRKSPFVVVNCSAIPEGLVESELFGHKRGAFTGASEDHVGKFAHAGKGTVLLDEIDALPPAAQTKLLHAVEDREFQPVGSTKTTRFEARIIAASNQDLEELMLDGKFRRDLFYRLDVYEMHLDSLRNRQDEIGYFVELFLKEFSRRNNCQSPGFSDAVIELFHQYPWPGNIRELRNCVEHALINSGDAIVTQQDLPPRLKRFTKQKGHDKLGVTRNQTHKTRSRPADSISPAQATWKKTKNEIERLLTALEETDYNRTLAARALGISRAAFYKKLNRYRLT